MFSSSNVSPRDHHTDSSQHQQEQQIRGSERGTRGNHVINSAARKSSESLTFRTISPSLSMQDQRVVKE
jgi:hypothetical protein